MPVARWLAFPFHWFRLCRTLEGWLMVTPRTKGSCARVRLSGTAHHESTEATACQEQVLEGARVVGDSGEQPLLRRAGALGRFEPVPLTGRRQPNRPATLTAGESWTGPWPSYRSLRCLDWLGGNHGGDESQSAPESWASQPRGVHAEHPIGGFRSRWRGEKGGLDPDQEN